MEEMTQIPNQDYATFENKHKKEKEQALTTMKNEYKGFEYICIYYIAKDTKTWRGHVSIVNTMAKELDRQYDRYKEQYESFVKIHGCTMILRGDEIWDDRNKYITTLRVASGSGKKLSQLELVNYDRLKEIIIDDNCFEKVIKFKLDHLTRLEKLVVGKKSFTRGVYVNKTYYTDASFIIMSCPSLTLIDIGECSFAEYGGEWKLSGLDKLKKLRIMSEDKESYNFNASPFVIKGGLMF